MNSKKNKVTVLLVFLSIVILVLVLFTLVRRLVPQSVQGPGSGDVRRSERPAGENAGRSGSGGGAAPGQSGAAGSGPARQQGESGAARSGGVGRAGGGSGPAQGSGGARGGAQVQRTAVRVTPVTPGTVENKVILSGDVLSSSQVAIYPAMAGKLTELRVKTGTPVSRGQVIALVDPSRPGDSFFSNPVLSTVTGVVLSVPASPGETVETRTAICVVGNLSDLGVEIHVPERYAVTMRRGLPAELSFEAMPGETFPAELDELSPVLDPASRTMRVRLRILPDRDGRRDPRIMAGMFATVSLVTDSRSGVPVLARSSLINTYGSWIVFTVEGEGEEARAKRKTVMPGLESEDTVEILSGLQPGERVVSAGQNFLNDGDPVRVVP